VEVELSGSQTLTIPIEMRVGGLEETITVAGGTLVVDVQSARRELVLNADVVQRFRPRATPGGQRQRRPPVADDDRVNTDEVSVEILRRIHDPDGE
jgi:hypothetical protein